MNHVEPPSGRGDGARGNGNFGPRNREHRGNRRHRDASRNEPDGDATGDQRRQRPDDRGARRHQHAGAVPQHHRPQHERRRQRQQQPLRGARRLLADGHRVVPADLRGRLRVSGRRAHDLRPRPGAAIRRQPVRHRPGGGVEGAAGHIVRGRLGGRHHPLHPEQAVAGRHRLEGPREREPERGIVGLGAPLGRDAQPARERRLRAALHRLRREPCRLVRERAEQRGGHELRTIHRRAHRRAVGGVGPAFRRRLVLHRANRH